MAEVESQEPAKVVERPTPGPWGWFGNIKHGSPYLATVHGGRRFVMSFQRLGMHDAQPVFQVNRRMEVGKNLAIYEVCREATSGDDPRVYRHDIIGFRSADARLLAAAPLFYEAATHGAQADLPTFLEWLADRLVHQYGEPEGVDFVHSLRKRAALFRTAIKEVDSPNG